MSEQGQFQNSVKANTMPAFPLIATELRTSLEVRFVPTADKHAGDLAHRGSIHKQASKCLDLSRALVLYPGLMEASERRSLAFLPRLS